ncbi:LacI family DNA-binding transcriptional regulator [Gracilibacillus phocaeensis]|uniref:LacI family DNA-binding transcriptional regulator n=1 Tax=Gracilibacillus phocaeensis TaxID=2042304 RepID=UPI00257012CA|nr:LacI family DNA-binding transcriptional regulator [Gracilibacillus phocaeensis]
MIIIKKVTIKDVARKANVSISTVSNALNGVDVLKPNTKQHILKVAEELNYIPNFHGKYLKSNATKILGLFIRSTKGPYYGMLIDAIANECEKNGYDLNVFITKNEKATINSVLGRSFDGAIIFNEWLSAESLQLLEKSNIPIIFLDREKTGKHISSVIFASYEGGQMVTQYLADQGHKKIGFIHGVIELYDDKERFRGYRDALNEKSLVYDENISLFGDFEEDTAYHAVRKFIHSGYELPDAFIAANDLSAIGCIKAFAAEGYSIPDDISVIGFDDIEISSYFQPKITTVRNPIIKQGVLAVDRLLDIIFNNEGGNLDKLKGEMIIRDSCIANNKKNR